MDVSINPLAVLLAALSTMVVGSVWYGKVGFYNQWARLAKVKEDPDFSSAQMAMLLGGAFLSSVVTAIVLAYFAGLSNLATEGKFLTDALLVGFMGWAGFTAARLHMHDAFEGRPKQLTFLNAAHEFVTIMIMAVIIGLFGY